MSDGEGASAPTAEYADAEAAESEASQEARESDLEAIANSEEAILRVKDASDLDELSGKESKVISLEAYRAAKAGKCSYAADYHAGSYEDVEPVTNLEAAVAAKHSHEEGLEGKVAHSKKAGQGEKWEYLLKDNEGKIMHAARKVWNFIATPFYYLQSVLNMYSGEEAEQMVKEMLERKEYLNDNNTITIALHGWMQNGSATWLNFMQRAREQGHCVIPLNYNFMEDNFKSAEKLLETIKDIKEKTGAKLYAVGHSQGAAVLRAVMQRGGSNYIQHAVTVDELHYGFNKSKGHFSVLEPFLTGEMMAGSHFLKELERNETGKNININFYGSGLVIRAPDSQQLKSTPNFFYGVGGHLQMMYQKYAMDLLLTGIYHPQQILGMEVNPPDPLTKQVTSIAQKKAA